MILGIGIDIIKIEKIRKTIERWGKEFLERVFEKEEIENIYKGKIYYQRLAARFAAKEAIIKAFSKNISLAFKDILILNRKNGAPYCKFKKNLEVEVFLSLTHIEDYAVACAVVQKKI
ncbi:MAG TPA: holo-[acyl-carrier-protein] synthase [Candidatus Omnitrophica bacterium]|nr:holo-[acyl-carrier-protein] synthase [Candidatus Omnitrophota bacterium]